MQTLEEKTAPSIDWPTLDAETTAIASRIGGWMLPAEIRALTCFAACPTAQGALVEIGCYHGKSTVVLAHASKYTPNPGVISVDPIEPEPLHKNLRQENLEHLVDFRNVLSSDFFDSWSAPIRALWHDGANDRDTVHNDIVAALPHMADGAIIAFHDIRNTTGDRVHNFIDDILASPHFGASGVIGTIGWSQYHKEPGQTDQVQKQKDKLCKALQRLRPYQNIGLTNNPRGLAKYHYKILRSRVPREEVTVQKLQQIAKATSKST